jgi:hypothetical protein
MQSLHPTITDSQLEEYIKTIHNYTGEMSSFCISEFEFKINHHPYYIYDENKNSNAVIRLFTKLNET